MGKNKSTNFIITDEIKENLKNKICSYLKLITDEEISDFFKSVKYSASKKGGKIAVNIQDGLYTFNFEKQGKKGHIMTKSNVVKYKSVLYTDNDIKKLTSIVSQDFENILYKNLDAFCSCNGTYELLTPYNFGLINFKISKDKKIIFTLKYSNELFQTFFSNSMKVESLDDHKNNLSPLIFKLDYDVLSNKIKASKFAKDIINKYTNKNSEFIIDFSANTISISDLLVREVITDKEKDRYNLEDLLPHGFINKINLAEKINKAVDRYKKEEDPYCQLKASVCSVGSVSNDIKLNITYKKKYIRDQICAETFYIINDETVESGISENEIFKEVLKELLEEYDIQRRSIDLAIEEKNNKLKNIKNNIDNLFKKDSYFENKELLVRSIMLFTNQNKFCSQSSLLHFLRGRKMSDYFTETEGYGAFKDVKKMDVEAILLELENLEILKEEGLAKHGSYCSIYKINNELKDVIMKAVSMSEIKKYDKHGPVYYVDYCNHIDRFTDENIDVLAEILEDEFLVLYLKKKLAQLIKKSDESIKQYVTTLAEIETKKDIRKTLEYICEKIN